jgi:hypothetical protein
MEQLELLEQELKMLLENIDRIKKFKQENEKSKWIPYQSRVVGELKHRMVALKQRMTLVSSISTNHLFR